MFKIIICGARIFTDYNKLKEVCDNILSKYQYDGYFHDLKDIEVISGHALGADLLGEKWAKSYGIRGRAFPLLSKHWEDMTPPVFEKTRANGTSFNALAGQNINQRMLDYAMADNDFAICIAFYKGDSKGSKGMVRIAKKARLPHYIWDDKKGKMRK